MEAYRFETIVSESGVVKIPLLNSLLNQEVEVIIIPKNDHSLKNDMLQPLLKSGQDSYQMFNLAIQNGSI